MTATIRPLNLAASRLALRSALGVALLIGAANTAHAHEHGRPGGIGDESLQSDAARAVARGEAAVARAPHDALLRAELGHAYLRAGRFESAAAALNDAVALGDTPDRIILSLALAQIACGQNRAALATLDHGASVAPADLGLALALAGDPGRGIAVLTDAVRDGSASTNLRQNLAYAYALDGRWADATLTAGFDLPPDQVNARLQQWAQSMQSGGERVRIARLLNVPLIVDQGMPATLALNVAQADPASAPAPIATAAPMPPAPNLVEAAPSPPPVSAAADPVPSAPAIAAIVAPLAPVTAAAPVPSAFHHIAVQAHGARPTSAHFVQLAAYHSRHSAELGKAILARRHPLLRGHGLLITEARRHGRSYWQVVMAGFDGASASSLCASLKRHGAACFAYSARPARNGQSLALADTLRRSASRP